MNLSGLPHRTNLIPISARRAATTAAAAVLAVLSGCCCMPCGSGCLPYETACLPAPSSYAMDFGSPDCGIPSYAVPGCDCPMDVMPGCEMPLAGDCGCCPPVMSASACDGCGVGGGCKAFPILRKLFCGWWMPRCPAHLADPYQSAYYCGDGCGFSPTVYEQPIYGGEVIHEGPVYHGPIESPSHFQAPMTAPIEEVTPTPVPAEPSAMMNGHWRSSDVRHVQHQSRPLARPHVRPANHTVTKPQAMNRPQAPSLRQQHAAWQPPPRW